MDPFINLLSDTAVEVFKKMILMDVNYVACEESLPEMEKKVHMRSMIEMNGNIRGAIVFHCTESLAKQVTCTLLGEDILSNIAEMDIKDALGEVTNVIAGNVKNKLSNNGQTFSISSPRPISWEEYEFEIKKHKEQKVFRFNSGKETFFFELLAANGSS